MKKMLLVLALLGMATTVGATPINGALSVTMNYLPVCESAPGCLALGFATGLDFIASVGGAATPGVAGVETVTSATGDFAGLPATGLIKDFSFTGAGSVNFPKTPLAAWETIGGLTFDMLTVTLLFQNQTALLLEGTGVFHLAGFEDTLGTFTLSANQAGTTFSASASKATVPEPSSMMLLGAGLIGLAAAARRRRVR